MSSGDPWPPLLEPEVDRTLFEEQSAILMQAVDEEAFSHHGKHYTLAPDVAYQGQLSTCAPTS